MYAMGQPAKAKEAEASRNVRESFIMKQVNQGRNSKIVGHMIFAVQMALFIFILKNKVAPRDRN